MRPRNWTCALVAFGFILAYFATPANGTTPKKIPLTSPCGVTRDTHYDHVVVIMLENVGYSIVGSPVAPYFNQLTHNCGLATNYVAVAHPSLPNYVALTSGSTQGITDDGEPSSHPLRTASIFSELGSNWRAQIESMPSACDRVTSGQYAARHNPAVYFTGISASCQRNDLPMRLPLNLSAAFTMIVPNICDDMHSCPVSVGDAWLRRIVPLIVASSQYQSRSLVLFITFDENDSMASNQVPTVVIAPSTPRDERVSLRFNHYSLLRTIETLLRVGLLGQSKTARSMISPFHL